jgi:hypothetical protein
VTIHSINYSQCTIDARVFGTQILLRNSNIAGEMKLMIDYDIPKKNQREAAIKAVNTMNTLQQISITAAKVEKELAPAVTRSLQTYTNQFE